jgi:hypothetical protein
MYQQIRPAGLAEVTRHGLAARRPLVGRPEVVNDKGVSEQAIETL